eukprot:scaffold7360_cov48-Phaeocystis_antarctica.AAC.2
MAARQTIDTSGSSSNLPWCHCPLSCLPNRTLRLPLTLSLEPYGRPGGRPTSLLGVVITCRPGGWPTCLAGVVITCVSVAVRYESYGGISEGVSVGCWWLVLGGLGTLVGLVDGSVGGGDAGGGVST